MASDQPMASSPKTVIGYSCKIHPTCRVFRFRLKNPLTERVSYLSLNCKVHYVFQFMAKGTLCKEHSVSKSLGRVRLLNKAWNLV